MNRQLTAHTVKLIVILTSVSLLGLIGTQSFWVRRAFIINREQFDHRADKTLMDVVEELRYYADSASRFDTEHGGLNRMTSPTQIMEVVDTNLLAALMKKYTEYHSLGKNYFYAIRKTSGDSVIYHSTGFNYAYQGSSPYKACLSCLWKDEYFHLALYFPDRNKSILVALFSWLFLSFIFLLVVIFCFIYIILKILKQKKLSEMKSDFINNMTHEFKTPISTISLASEVLLYADPKTSQERIKRYATIIYEENQRMKTQVDRVMQLALYDNHDIILNKTEVDLHEAIKTSIHNLCLEKSEKEVDVRYELNISDPVIAADKMHLCNIIINIVENAIKYSGIRSEIKVVTSPLKEGILMSIIDNGIGISPDVQKYIFDRFYRAHTGDVHNVKGFGIGLYYVKSMVEAHGGSVNVISELNKGSRFNVYLPR